MVKVSKQITIMNQAIKTCKAVLTKLFEWKTGFTKWERPKMTYDFKVGRGVQKSPKNRTL